ncbi:hypothetical protein HAX54_034737 [Datura stramonium]|uniref:DNA-directed RNA polymerase n=1 Tax=Datura stramonium TaxID=4076 RepID=A0ABS8VGQ2_DATST|nr:hypothetical protein [Datura stramonium]
MGALDDMNHLKNKRIHSVADLLQDQLGLTLVRLENVVRGTICGAIRHKLIPTPSNLVTSIPLKTTYESFFDLHPLSQVLDRTNPLTHIVHGRKSSFLGPGGLTGRTANFQIRDIYPSHYGRIFPIDTSEGINVGLIGSLAIHARIGNGDILSISLAIYQRSNKNTCMHQKLQVPRGKCIKKGQILADGATTVGGKLALGKNVLVAYISWEGYNSEDAILISERLVSTSKETCLKLPIGGRGRVIDVRWIQKRGGSSYNPETIRVYISQKREIKVGDKVAGRHGNKGIISKILPRQDMPYLQDGRSVDMVFNPLGVPSRMNVGQIFECSLGLAGSLLDRHYRIAPFDERYEQEASRKLVFSELYEASKQTANPWVFEPKYLGKSRIFDGRTGNLFEQPVIIRKPYILKLIHQVDDKIHGHSSGHYALVTQQPLRGRAKQGG